MWTIKNQDVLTGFKVGRLAGLDQKDRAARQQDQRGWRGVTNHSRLFGAPPLSWQTPQRCTSATTKASLGCTLEEALDGATASSLKEAMKVVNLHLRSGARKDELVHALAMGVPMATDQFATFLATIDDESFDITCRAASGAVITHEGSQRSERSIPNLLPFVFACQDGSSICSFMPDELQRVFSKVGYASISRRRSLLSTVATEMDTHLSLCGIATPSQLFSHLQEQSQDTCLSREEFDEALNLLLGSHVTHCHSFSVDGEDYLQHELLGWIRRDTTYWFKYTCPSAPSLYLSWKVPMQTKLSKELLVDRRRSLISRFEGTAAQSGDVASYVYGLECVLRLTSFFDAHVPQGQDDLTFADQMVDLLIYLVMIQGQSLAAVLGWLTKTGWFLCEGTNSAPRLTKLIYDFYREIPRWEYGGWSELELMDLMSLPCIISESQPFENIGMQDGEGGVEDWYPLAS